MNKYSFLAFSILIVISCCSDDDILEPGPTICLEDFEIDINPVDCQDEIKDDCEMLYQGSSSLSDGAKAQFNNFCPGINSTLTFENSNNVVLFGFLTEKTFETDIFSIKRYSKCQHFCLDNENAKIILVSDKFSLRINLLTSLTHTINSMVEIIPESQTVYSILAFTKNQETGSSVGQQIFELPIEDSNNEPVVDPDTTHIRFHETINLNNTTYSNVYSNENNENVTGNTRKEKVYFNQEIGLIAVRDSFGMLWTKVD